MLSPMIEVTVVCTALDFSCIANIEASTFACLHHSTTLENSEEKTTTTIQHINDDICWFLCQPRHQTVKWVFRSHLNLPKRKCQTYICGLSSCMWLRSTIKRPFYVCVSIYAFLICRWLKRKSPVAHELRAAYAFEYIRVACRKIRNNSKSAHHTHRMQRYFPRKQCHHCSIHTEWSRTTKSLSLHAYGILIAIFDSKTANTFWMHFLWNSHHTKCPRWVLLLPVRKK